MSPTGGIEETGHMVYFNSDFSYVVVLFKGFTVTTILDYILASLFILVICWSERLMSYYLENVIRYDKNYSRSLILLIRTVGFSVVTILRLFYMLITMTMNSQLFVMVVVALTTGQFVVEYIRSTTVCFTINRKGNDETSSNETLGGNESSICNKIIIDAYTDELSSNNFVISNMEEEDDVNDDDNNNNNININNDNNNNNSKNNIINNYNDDDDDDDDNYNDESALNNSQQRIIISNQ